MSLRKHWQNLLFGGLAVAVADLAGRAVAHALDKSPVHVATCGCCNRGLTSEELAKVEGQRPTKKRKKRKGGKR